MTSLPIFILRDNQAGTQAENKSKPAVLSFGAATLGVDDSRWWRRPCALWEIKKHRGLPAGRCQYHLCLANILLPHQQHSILGHYQIPPWRKGTPAQTIILRCLKISKGGHEERYFLGSRFTEQNVCDMEHKEQTGLRKRQNKTGILLHNLCL